MWELDAVVCTADERSQLRQLFGERVRLLGVGEVMCGHGFSTVIATQAALESMHEMSEKSREWVHEVLHVRTSPNGRVSPALEEFLSPAEDTEDAK